MELLRSLDDDRPEHLGVLHERGEVAHIRELPDDPDAGTPEERGTKLLARARTGPSRTRSVSSCSQRRWSVDQIARVVAPCDSS